MKTYPITWILFPFGFIASLLAPLALLPMGITHSTCMHRVQSVKFQSKSFNIYTEAYTFILYKFPILQTAYYTYYVPGLSSLFLTSERVYPIQTLQSISDI